MKSLDKLSIGDVMTVKSLEKNSRVRRRLLDMGITIGAMVKVRGKAPLGDPIEIGIRGYRLTLRKEEASIVLGE